MNDLMVCELCGVTFNANTSSDICSACSQSDSANNGKINTEAKSLRQTAKSLGAKALKGTAKQKKWAESIRKSFVENATNIDAVKSMILHTPALLTAKFWIEARNNSSLESDLAEIIELTEKANAGDTSILTQRLELIAKVGL